MTCNIPFMVIAPIVVTALYAVGIDQWVNSRWWPPSWNHVPWVSGGMVLLVFWASVIGVFLYTFKFCL